MPRILKLARQADVVLVGQVTQDEHVQPEDPGGIHDMTIAKVRIEKVEKGRLGRRTGKLTVYAADRRGGEAEGLEGCDCRQGIPVAGESLRFFLERDPERPGYYRVLYAGPTDLD